MLEVNSKKHEMEIGDENSNITEREMVDQSCGMEPRTQLKIQDQQIYWQTKKKGKTTNSSNKLKTRLEI